MGISRERAAECLAKYAVNKTGRAAIIAKLGAGLRQDWEDIWQECLLVFLRDCHRAENPDAFFAGVVNHLAIRHVQGAVKQRKRKGVMDEKHEPVCFQAEFEQDARPAKERLTEIVSRLPRLRAAQFHEWRARGFRCENNAQRTQVSRIMAALRVAAGCEGKKTRFAFMKAA